MGPHPAVAEIRRAVRVLLDPDRCVLVACSGGADSLALAAATAFVAPRMGVRAGLVTVDHGLQDGSGAQAARVAALGFELGFDPVQAIRVDVGGGAGGPEGAARAGGPEGAARTARYAALDAAATALDADVLLGHTLDDQAETVLLGLGRGSGPRSIAGMRACDGSGDVRRLRPFLGVRRETTRAACAALGLPVWDDPHNADPSYRRVRLRREVLPLLEDVLAGGVAPALARTAALVQDDLDALDQLADAARDHLEVEALVDQPRAIRSRVLRGWAQRLGAQPLAAGHLAALERLCTDWHGQGPINLPGGVSIARASGKLVPQSAQPQPARSAQSAQPPQSPTAQEQPRA